MFIPMVSKGSLQLYQTLNLSGRGPWDDFQIMNQNHDFLKRKKAAHSSVESAHNDQPAVF